MITPEKRSQITNDAANAYRTGRNFEEYARQFGYFGKEHELQGKKILDVGAGHSSFGFEAEQQGATVVSLDASYLYSSPFYRKNAVTGLAQELPFKNESFDEVIASWSLYWVNTGIENALGEMLRVTKKDHYLKIFPVTVYENFSHPSISVNHDILSGNSTLFVKKTPDVTVADFSTDKISYRNRNSKPNGFIA